MSQSMASVRSLYVPLEEATLLLPSTVVAEIVPYNPPSPPTDTAPDWLLGSVIWREQRIPLISLDAMLTGERAGTGQRARIAVLKALANREDLPYYGIVTKQIPRLLTVYEESVESLDEGAAAHAMVAAEVLANGEPAIIPNLDLIESELYGVLNP